MNRHTGNTAFLIRDCRIGHYSDEVESSRADSHIPIIPVYQELAALAFAL
jgi:hypothetical protein